MRRLLFAWERRSIAWKLPASIGVLLALAMLAMALIAYGRVQRAMIGVADGHLLGASQQVRDMLQGAALQRYTGMDRVAHEAPVRASLGPVASVDSAIAASQLEAYLASNPAVLAVEVRDASMTPRVTLHGRTVAYPIADLRALADSPGAATGATGPFRMLGDTVLYPSIVPIRSGSRISGWVVDWRRLTGNAQAARQLSDLIGEGAHLLVGNRSNDLWTDLAEPASGPMRELGDTLARYHRADAATVLARAAQVPTTAWSVVVEVPEEQAVGPARQFLYGATGLALLLGIAGAAAGTLLSRGITTPLKQLATAASDLASGKESVRVDLQREDELGDLGRAFNAMADQLASGRANLATTLAEYQLLFERNPLPMWVNDRHSLRILQVNDAALRAYGFSREEILGRTILDLRPPEDAAQCLATISREDYVPGATERWTHWRSDGSLMEVEVSRAHLTMRGRPVAFVLVNDVTERVAAEHALAESHEALRRSQEQLLHSQKMEALGRLAGAVAHDFNNLTAAILGYAELLSASLDRTDARRADAEEIQRAAKRAAELTSRLLSFSRRQIAELRPVQLNDVVTQTDRLLRRLIGADIELVTRLDDNAGTIQSDPGLVEQALLNLAVNARDAMPDGGSLTIETASVVLDETYVERHLDARLGEHVLLTVSDSGSGIPPDILSHVFEPFFTTKPQGQGTGIGLSTVYGIVRQSGGHVDLYTEVGRGTVFKLYFPQVEQDAGDRRTPGARQVVHAGGDETILLVEDDSAVRAVTRRVLKVLGYDTIEASSGSSALDLAADPSKQIDLVLSDVVMPDLSGPDLAAILRERIPHARVIFMSGYTDDAVVRQGMLARDAHFLQKPFSLQQLALKLREVLDQPN